MKIPPRWRQQSGKELRRYWDCKDVKRLVR